MPEFENGNMPDTLEFPCDPESLPTSSELPLGDIILEGKSLEEKLSNPVEPGTVHTEGRKIGQPKVGEKQMVVAQFAVVEPEDYAGILHTHRFVLGTDLDPKAKKDSTWKQGAATLFLRMRQMAGIGGKTMAETKAAFPGQKVGVSVRKGKANGDYPARNEIKDFWKPGTKQVKVTEDTNADLNAALGRSASIPNHPAYANND